MLHYAGTYKSNIVTFAIISREYIKAFFRRIIVVFTGPTNCITKLSLIEADLK